MAANKNKYYYAKLRRDSGTPSTFTYTKEIGDADTIAAIDYIFVSPSVCSDAWQEMTEEQKHEKAHLICTLFATGDIDPDTDMWQLVEFYRFKSKREYNNYPPRATRTAAPPAYFLVKMWVNNIEFDDPDYNNEAKESMMALKGRTANQTVMVDIQEDIDKFRQADRNKNSVSYNDIYAIRSIIQTQYEHDLMSKGCPREELPYRRMGDFKLYWDCIFEIGAAEYHRQRVLNGYEHEDGTPAVVETTAFFAVSVHEADRREDPGTERSFVCYGKAGNVPELARWRKFAANDISKEDRRAVLLSVYGNYAATQSGEMPSGPHAYNYDFSIEAVKEISKEEYNSKMIYE